VRYFASRHGRVEAEDLAQNTLFKVWEREDYQFQNVSDFPKVCLGFARNVSFEGFRSERNSQSTLDFDTAAPAHRAESHRAAESRILLDEVCKTGAARLKPREWGAILGAVSRAESVHSPVRESSESNRDRVFLHRARRKLREITGWRGK
jgi:DNA-directed RNA polymerase specialized sigma24 family protein